MRYSSRGLGAGPLGHAVKKFGGMMSDEKKKAITSSDLYRQSHAICPYCGEADEDEHGDHYSDGDVMTNVCPHCDREYRIEFHMSVEFSTTGICTEPHQLQRGASDVSPYMCQKCYREFYDWQLPGGDFPTLKAGEFVIIQKG